MAKSTLQNWIEGKSDPSFGGLVQLADAAGVSVQWLATGEGPMERAGGESLSRRGLGEAPVPPYRGEQLGEGFCLVPRFDISASAGPGALAEEENIVDHLAFQESWVRRTLRVDPSRLVLITAVGDSMEPTIRAGDLLLIDTGVNEFADDAIYVVAIDGHLLVKRIQRFFGGAVTVKSDNDRNYVDQTLSPDDAASVRVAGRVRWIGRMT